MIHGEGSLAFHRGQVIHKGKGKTVCWGEMGSSIKARSLGSHNP